MLKEYFEKVQQPNKEISPVLKFFGIRADLISKEKTVFTLPIKPEFFHAGGFTAGGLMATLADEAMGHVASANLAATEGTATIEMNIRYLKTVKSGELRAVATVVKKGRHVVTVQAEVTNDSDEIVAQAGASFTVFDREAFFQAQKAQKEREQPAPD